MKHLTQTIPLPLAEKLKEKGMPIKAEVIKNKSSINPYSDRIVPPVYAEVFDWLMFEKNTNIYFDKDKGMWSVFIENENNPVPNCAYMQEYSTWHEAANAAIEKALTLI